MVHPLVEQLRFTRSELKRALRGVSAEDAQFNLKEINSMSWVVAHLAAQEDRYYNRFGQDIETVPDLQARFGFGCEPSSPTLTEAWSIWKTVTDASDLFLDSVTNEMLLEGAPHDPRSSDQATSVGNMLQRTIYHYWYHLGETQAIRQYLGHQRLPTFVGDIDAKAPYRPAQPQGKA